MLVNLALAFARRGLRSGILDTDIFGPSIPTLLNLSGEPRLSTSPWYYTHNLEVVSDNKQTISFFRSQIMASNLCQWAI